MFKEERSESLFRWSDLGDLEEGRPNLGSATDVLVYRLMQFTLRDVMIKEFGVEKADKVLYQAGELAGSEFYKNLLSPVSDFSELTAKLQEYLRDLRIGILRVEKSDPESGEFIFTIAEDLDCSGIPVVSEQVCNYDEGFLSGILREFTGKAFQVREVDCWASGDRVCRFQAKGI